MRASEFLKRYERDQKAASQAEEVGKAEEEDHSLQAHAKERAKHPEHMNAGTAFDWEDMEGYQNELERLDREGPGRNPNSDGRKQ